MVTYNYASKKLWTILGIRLLPWSVFFILAILVGEIFWLGAIALLVEAVIEVIWKAKIAYVQVGNTKIKSMGIFGSSEIKWADVKSTFVYNNEWTFRTAEKEIRVNTNWVKASQREDLKNQLGEARCEILKRLAAE